MTRVMKAAFPSLPEVRNFIKNLKWSKLFLQNLLSAPFHTTVSINTKYE